MKKLNIEDFIGKKFGRLTIIKEDILVKKENDKKYKRRRVICSCDCGVIKSHDINSVLRSTTLSCGCFLSESSSLRNSSHKKSRTLEYYIWCTMKARCYNPNNTEYHNYGGRGIKVCDRWLHSFENFLEDMGEKPTKDHSLDKYPNNDGDYEPNNCRWATEKEQQRNRRNNKLIEYKGEIKILIDWTDELNLNYKTTLTRLNRLKWTVEDAFEIPNIGKRQSKKNIT